MSKIVSFFKRPRNIYFSMIMMLTLVTGLVSISFSYYIDESSTNGLLKLTKVDNRLQSDELVDGYISLAPHETKEIKVYVMSNNDFESKYALYYKTDSNAKVISSVNLDESIGSKEVQEYELFVANFDDKDATVFLGIENGKIDADIEVDGNLVEIAEQ